MTIVGGLLVLVNPTPSPRSDGLTLHPLAAASTLGSTTSANPLTQTRKAVDTERWQAIVIHHSGSMVGNAGSIAKEHQSQGLSGLGHHFVIGNGSSGMDDGQIHIGYRWLDQLPGAHAAGPHGEYYNHHAISICIVGDGNRRGFTPIQIQQVRTLIDALRRQLNLPADRVLLYSDIDPASADPGKLFPAGLNGLPSGVQTP